MKARFLEILQEHCDEYGISIDSFNGPGQKSRKYPYPLVKKITIQEYLSEYPNTMIITIAHWLGMHHSSVIHLRDTPIDQFDRPPIRRYDVIKDFSSFMSTGYKRKIRFQYVDAK